MNGSLSEFTLAQLLQFFAIAERSGTVVVRTVDKESRLLIEGDRISGWGFDDIDVRAMLLGCGLLPAHLTSSLTSLVRRDDTPGLSLVVRNLVEPGRWDAFTRRILEQDIYPLMNTEDGEFVVTIGRCPPAPLRLSLQVNSLILDTSRWESEMEAAAVEGLSIDSRWQRSTPLTPPSMLSGEEWLVWAGLRQPLTLGDVASQLCIPDLVTVAAIRRLARMKLIESVESSPERLEQDRAEQRV